MLQCIIVATFTFGGQLCWGGAISPGLGIMEVGSMEGESVISEGMNCEPSGGSPLPGKVHSPPAMSLAAGCGLVVQLFGNTSWLCICSPLFKI